MIDSGHNCTELEAAAQREWKAGAVLKRNFSVLVMINFVGPSCRGGLWELQLLKDAEEHPALILFPPGAEVRGRGVCF